MPWFRAACSSVMPQQRHQNKAGGSRASGLSKDKHHTHWFGVADAYPACPEARSILAAQHTRLHPGCTSTKMLCYDLLCLEIGTATQSGFIQPSGPGSKMNTTPFSLHFRPEVTSYLLFSFLPPLQIVSLTRGNPKRQEKQEEDPVQGRCGVRAEYKTGYFV